MPSQFENLRRFLKTEEVQVQTNDWPKDSQYSLFFCESMDSFDSVTHPEFPERLKDLATEIAASIPSTKMMGGSRSGGFTVVFNNEAARVEMLKTLDRRIDEVASALAVNENPRITNWPFNPGWN